MLNQIIEVIWEDSYSRLGWGDVSEAVREALEHNFRCVSVGYLLEETEDRIVLVRSLAFPDLVDALHVIPKSCIYDIRALCECVEDSPDLTVTIQESEGEIEE